MKTKIQIKSIFGYILFEFKKENNSIKEALLEAIKSGADLSGADLIGADLSGADLSGAIASHTTAMYFSQCPSEGSFIGWKTAQGKIIKLLITEDAKRSSATTLKCRCSKAKVLAIEELDGKPSELNAVASDRTCSFIYTIGETVEVLNYDNERFNECSTGIHFFISREAAVFWYKYK